MKTYKFDWKDTVTGTIEIEASSAKEADEKFKNMLWSTYDSREKTLN